VQKRVASDPAFGEALLREGIDTMLTGDVDTGKAILRDYIKATVGFEKLGEATGTQPKSLIRMFGPRGIRSPATSAEPGQLSLREPGGRFMLLVKLPGRPIAVAVSHHRAVNYSRSIPPGSRPDDHVSLPRLQRRTRR
jgi:hypothetical protein